MSRSLLPWARRIDANLARIRDHGAIAAVPNQWQLGLGVLRLWHRLLFRTDTVGRSPTGRVRATWRARALAWRALRLPFLLAEGAVRPLDFTGLASTPAELRLHLLAAHHDENQFVYDLEILAAYGELPALADEVRALRERDDDRARWLRDLTVFEGYHDELLAAVDAALAAGPRMTAGEARDPDISFAAYLRWCSEQPATPAATLAAWRSGAFRFDSPLQETA